MKCVNKSLPEYKSLKEKTGLPDLVLSSIITEFQFKFKNDEFPSIGYINNRPAFNRDVELNKFYNTDSGQTFWIGLSTKDKLEILKKYKNKYPSLDVRFETSYGNQYLKLVAYNKTVSEQVSKEAFMNLVNNLSKRLNIPYNIITKDDAKKILGNQYNGEPAFFYKGKVYFTEFSIENPIHEFAHPFVRAIIKTNPDLFMNIMDEVIKEHPNVYDEVQKLYPEYFNEQGEVSLLAYEEMAVRAITKLGIGNIDTKTGESVLQRLWDIILNFIQSIVGGNIKIGDIKPNAKLKDLADLLTSFKGTINLETTPVKPGVSELFESNLELANQIYEALGLINTSEIQLDKPRFNPDNFTATSYPIKINDKYAGVISVNKDGYISSSIGMAGVELEKEFQGKGYGTKVYIALAEQLDKEGKTLKSEAFGKQDINEAANRVWKSLLDKGYAIDKGAYFEIQLKDKQQAQLAYSQYLDTVFPDSKVKDIVYHGTDKQFDKFDKELSGNKTGWAKDNKGIHFVNNKIAAETYTKSKEDGYGYLALWIYLKEDAKSGKSLTKEEFNNILSDNTKLANTLEGAHYFGAIDIDRITFEQYDKWAKLFEKDEQLNDYYRNNLDEILKSVTEKYKNKRANVKSVVLNIKNPLIYDSKGKRYVHEIKDIYSKLENENDGIIVKNTLDRLNDDIGFEDDIQVVFEPEQIHVLSSKADIQGFKDFMSFENSEFSKHGMYQQFRDFVTSKSSIEIENRLIETGKIDRVC